MHRHSREHVMHGDWAYAGIEAHRAGYALPTEDPATDLLLAVMLLALKDWERVASGRHYKLLWALPPGEAAHYADQEAELLDFFLSPEFDGMCLLLGAEPEVVHRGLVQKGIRRDRGK